MYNTNGIQQYYRAIRDRLKNYIKSDYLANSETLLLYVDDLLGEHCSQYTNIANEPYIETSASYKKIINGIRDSQQIDQGIKDSLLKLEEENLGVFSDPFEHQVHALEYFLSGNDLFISPVLVQERPNVSYGQLLQDVSRKQKPVHQHFKKKL